MLKVEWQHVDRYIIHDSGGGRTVSLFTSQIGLDLTGKHCPIGKAMHKSADLGIEGKSSSDLED